MCEMCNRPSMLGEYRIIDIRSRSDVSDPERVRRAKKLVSYYRGVTDSGDIIFETQSQTFPSKYYTEVIRLYDLPILIQSPLYVNNWQRLLKDSLSGNVGIYCSDPSFLYWGWQYISFTFHYGWSSAVFPSIRNPTLYGGACKHILHCFMVLPFNFYRVYSDMKRKIFLKSQLEY